MNSGMSDGLDGLDPEFDPHVQVWIQRWKKVVDERDALLAIIEGLPEPPYNNDFAANAPESGEHRGWREAQEAAKKMRGGGDDEPRS